jgi:hypothetical protein
MLVIVKRLCLPLIAAGDLSASNYDEASTLIFTDPVDEHENDDAEFFQLLAISAKRLGQASGTSSCR